MSSLSMRKESISFTNLSSSFSSGNSSAFFPLVCLVEGGGFMGFIPEYGTSSSKPLYSTLS